MDYTKIDEFCVCNRQTDEILEHYSVLFECHTNTFYKIQLVYNKKTDDYTFYCKYGGKNKPQFTIIYENKLTKQEAIDKFKTKFEKKLGISFDSGEIDTSKTYKGYKIML